MEPEQLVRDYLGRLEAAALRLPADRRSELIAEIREHIELSAQEAGSRDEATIRTILDRLGSPETIVAAEEGGEYGNLPSLAVPPNTSAPSTPGESRWGLLETTAALLVTAGAVILPILGPLVGIVLIIVSTRATWRTKFVLSTTGIALTGMLFVVIIPVGSGGPPPATAIPVPTPIYTSSPRLVP
jgi:uncharacterized membrane protein